MNGKRSEHSMQVFVVRLWLADYLRSRDPFPYPSTVLHHDLLEEQATVCSRQEWRVVS